MALRFSAYIDGFNLYKGALQNRPNLKWLNLVSYCQSLMPEHELVDVYYFTANLKERYPGDDAPRRQHTYLRVLENQNIRVVRGKFRKNEDWVRLSTTKREFVINPVLPSHFGLTQVALDKSKNKALPNLPLTRVSKFEEKGSDVNLASYLLRDAYTGVISAALVVTGDSDIATPITLAKEAGVAVQVLVPNKNQKCDELRQSATSLRQMHLRDLAIHQLPATFITPKGRLIHRPESWC